MGYKTALRLVTVPPSIHQHLTTKYCAPNLSSCRQGRRWQALGWQEVFLDVEQSRCRHEEPVGGFSPGAFIWGKWVKRSVASDSMRPHRQQPTRLLCPRDSQARILEWVAMPSSRGSSQPRDQTQVSHIAGRFFTSWATREAPIMLYENWISIKLREMKKI